MTWISLVCLLAISSSAFARNLNYGGYGSQIPQLSQIPQVSSLNLVRDFTSQQPSLPQAGYGQQQQQQQQTFVQQQQDEQTQPEVQQVQSGYGQQYGGQSMIRKPMGQFDQSYNKVQLQQPQTFPSQMQLLEEQKQKLQQIIDQASNPTEADIICRGQRPETVIPIDNNRRFVTCLDDGKGQVQECSRGLFFHPESRRCERKLGPLPNPCASQPCLNNGQCVQTDVTSYKCQCAPGFDGEQCELDARVCQTQQPCGQSPDAKCQSFRFGAALTHICILQGGHAYGLTATQAQSSPCTGEDTVLPLAFTDKGFIMCSGELMFVESCPGGTVWDELNKACVWPDMKGLAMGEQTSQTSNYGGSSYGQIQRPISTPLIGEQMRVLSYGQQPKLIKDEDYSSYGQVQPPKPLAPPKLIKDEGYSSYGQVQPPKPITPSKPVFDESSSYGQVSMKSFTQPKPVFDETQSYGSKIQMPVQQDFTQQSYGGYQQQQQMPKQIFTQPMIRQQDFIRPQQQQQTGY